MAKLVIINFLSFLFMICGYITFILKNSADTIISETQPMILKVAPFYIELEESMEL